jgi:hypothetical protein
MVPETVQVLELVANCATNLDIEVNDGLESCALKTYHAALLATMATFTIGDDLFVNRLVSLDYLWVPNVQRQREMLPVELFKFSSRVDHWDILHGLIHGLVRISSLCSLDLGILRNRRKLRSELARSVLWT